ncbi:MAG TPA: ABC transporter ATP-binding protein [Terriglobia bacterium]|nr:ABC transporter ATP-binding protein [Terriglobia bacterium]
MLRAENLTKIFQSGEEEVAVFENLNFEIQPGEMVALVGTSGAGKTTLLHLLAAMDTPTQGEVYFLGKRLSSFSKDEQAAYRNAKVGFVWQMHYLLPEFTAAENVMLPQLIAGGEFSAARVRARELLAEVGLGKIGDRRAGEISGGEQQRVALARALANQPAILLADEPTGNLDARSAEAVMEMLERLHREHSLTTIVATHNLELARRARRKWGLSGGQLTVTSSQSQQSE